MEKKYLIAYFQLKNANEAVTVSVADSIFNALQSKGVNVDKFAITPVETYSSDKDIFLASTKAEKETHARPAIVGKFSGYKDITDVILVTPNWWNSVPMAILTFFDEMNTNNKRLIPVVIHSGDGAQLITEELRNFLPNTDVMEAIEVNAKDKASDATLITKVMQSLKMK